MYLPYMVRHKPNKRSGYEKTDEGSFLKVSLRIPYVISLYLSLNYSNLQV